MDAVSEQPGVETAPPAHDGLRAFLIESCMRGYDMGVNVAAARHEVTAAAYLDLHNRAVAAFRESLAILYDAGKEEGKLSMLRRAP